MSFAGASTSALTFAWIGNKISEWFQAKSQTPNPSITIRGLTPIVSKCISPVFALSSAHLFDLFIIQSHTWLHGISVKDEHEQDIVDAEGHLMQSQIAGRKIILQTAVQRIATANMALLCPSLILPILKVMFPSIKTNPKVAMGTELGLNRIRKLRASI